MKHDLARVFIGYDAREAVAFNVLSHSIQLHASRPVMIAPVMLDQLRGCFGRTQDPLQSTDFSFSRFLVPYLCGYQGWSIFMDCDMLALEDIYKLWALRDDRHAVMVVKHDYVPKEETKFLNAVQTKYAKKNWSSVMLFNNAKCGTLTPEYVNSASGLELHQFKWLESDDLIGAIPSRWNYLVGCDQSADGVAVVHYTIGGPYFSEYADCEFSAEWFKARDALLVAAQRSA